MSKGSGRRPPSRPDLLPCETAGHAPPDRWGKCLRCSELVQQRESEEGAGEVKTTLAHHTSRIGLTTEELASGADLHTILAARYQMWAKREHDVFAALPGAAVPHQGDTER